MKTTNLILTVIMFGMLVTGYVLQNIENEEIKANQETIILNNELTNERITKFNRQNSTDFVQMHRIDYCKDVRNHIDKTHSPNHLTCKDYKAIIK